MVLVLLGLTAPGLKGQSERSCRPPGSPKMASFRNNVEQGPAEHAKRVQAGLAFRGTVWSRADPGRPVTKDPRLQVTQGESAQLVPRFLTLGSESPPSQRAAGHDGFTPECFGTGH